MSAEDFIRYLATDRALMLSAALLGVTAAIVAARESRALRIELRKVKHGPHA